MSSKKLTTETILIPTPSAINIGHYSADKEYTIKEFYGFGGHSCIITDNENQDDHFYTDSVLNFFTVKLTTK